MATETWVMDGVALSSLAFDIRTWNGLDNTPGVNVSGSGSGTSGGTNGMFQLAQSHGEFWYPQYYTASTKLLTMYVSSNDVSGNPPASVDQGRQNFDANLDLLSRLFARRRNLSSLVRNLSGGTSRLALCTVMSTIEPQLVPVTNGQITVELTIPDGFWRDASDTNLVPVFAPGTARLTALDPATAPMNDLQFTITGPVTNPRITDNESGSWVQYTGTVAAAKTLVIRNTTMDITDGGSGWVPALINMVHSGDSNWLTLYPTAANGVNITFGGSATTGATNLLISGHKKFMR